MIQNIKIGNPAQVAWSLFHINGDDFSLEGHTLRLYYCCGRGKGLAKSVIHQDNTLVWAFSADSQWATGFYTLILEVYANNVKVVTIDYPDAFYLGDADFSDDLQASQLTNEVVTTTVNIMSAVDLYRFSSIVPVVGSDGYWYVNGQKVVDGEGEYVPASHTVTYDSTSNKIYIDYGRVDSEGHSITQEITAIADALSAQQTAYEDAEAARNESFAEAEADRKAYLANLVQQSLTPLVVVGSLEGDSVFTPDEEPSQPSVEEVKTALSGGKKVCLEIEDVTRGVIWEEIVGDDTIKFITASGWEWEY